MYKVFCDGYPLLDLRDNDLILVNPKVKLAVNKVGEASFTMYKNHPHYDKLKRSRSIFEIADEIGVIFRGRMTGDTIDFDNGKAVDLEGAMAYFNDSIVRPYHFPDDFSSDPEYIAASKSGNVIQFYLNWVITNHNNQVQEFQRFKLGNVTVTDPNNYLYRYGEKYASTWETLQADLFNSALGGYLCIRYEDDGNYIDYLSKFEQTNTQEIVFGENLMDLKNETDVTATYSAIIPLGGEIQRTINKGTVEGAYVDFELTETIKEELNIKGLADGYVTDDIVKQGDTLYSVSAVQQCGWIYAPTAETTWDDVTKAENLLMKGIEWLQTKGMMSSNTIEVTAVDLHFSDAEIISFRMYRNINVRSAPHGVVSTYPLSELDIDLLNPQSTKITVGESRLTLIDKQYSENTSTTDKIVNMNSQGTLVGIANVKTVYYLSTSGEELEGGEWVTEEPTRTDGTYIWTKSIILYTDKSTYESPPSCSAGAKGDPGIGVDLIETEFYLSDSDTTQSGGSWVTAMPKWSEGKYLWVRSVVHYSDGSTSYTAPICDSTWEAVKDLDESLNQMEVFNRLTKNGSLQGLYMEDGKLYVNADYIKTGSLVADLIKGGVLSSLDGNMKIDLGSGTLGFYDENGTLLGNFADQQGNGFALYLKSTLGTYGVNVVADENNALVGVGNSETTPTYMQYKDGKGTVSGDIVIAKDAPTAANHAVNLQYLQDNFRPSDWTPSASDVGAAPAGYGLGGGARYVTDLNTALSNGFYYWGTDAVNAPFNPANGGGAMLVIARDGANYVDQIAFDNTQPSYIPICVRQKVAGTWSAWQDCSPSAFAPAGYGLGKATAKGLTSADDLNSIKANGWYSWYGDMPQNAPMSYSIMRVWTDGFYVLQEAISAHTNQGNCIIRRWNGGVSWTSWGYDNPPMMLGVEYITTEFYNGNHVYKKLVQKQFSGTLGNTSGYVDYWIPSGLSEYEILIKAEATIDSKFFLPYISSTGGIASILDIHEGNVRFRINNDTWNSPIVTVMLYYTKTI